MKIALTEEGIVLSTSDTDDAKVLEGLWKQGHLHLVCKYIGRRKQTKRAFKLLLLPSAIRWVRGGSKKRKKKRKGK